MRRHLRFILALALTPAVSCDDRFFPTVASVGTPFSVVATNPALIVTPATARINAGSTLRLSTNFPVSVSPLLDFASLSPNIASVDQFGLVTGLTPGFVSIRVTSINDPFNFTTVIVEVISVNFGFPTFP
ncbi:MAG TPA: Ig-like domain-containing protein [Gemmatimonadaceae bacterium]